MNGRGTPVLALSVVVATVALCMALPSVDPSCVMGNEPARAVAACAAIRADSRELALIALAIAMITGAVLVGSISVHSVLHHRITHRLELQARPAVIADQVVGLVSGSGPGAALVAGLVRPRIYCSEDLVWRLDADELRAVLLHERHHQLAHAPSQLIVLSAVESLVGHFGPAAAWLERQRASVEIAADQHALCHGATRASLARAILKMQDGAPSLTLAGFASAGELRLRALLGEGGSSRTPRTFAIWQTLAVGVVVALVCSALPLA